jgi:hypothetical protein
MLPCIATDKETVKKVLIELLTGVLENMDSNK